MRVQQQGKLANSDPGAGSTNEEITHGAYDFAGGCNSGQDALAFPANTKGRMATRRFFLYDPINEPKPSVCHAAMGRIHFGCLGTDK